MSDSESDLLSSNVFTFQNENTTVCAKGPNINNANYTNSSFRNNVMTSTMHLSRNFGRHHYGEPSCDQRSMYNRRETSPMSLYSGSDIRRRNLSYYNGGMSSQRSMYNGRSGSPMSMRSIDSNASVSAVDIALAFKNVKFNKYDLRMIKEAYNKFMKRRIRKKIEKRRNMRLFLKGYRRKSGYDSGEQGSDSSITSDECKSTTSAMYKENLSSCRSTRTDLTDFRKSIKESNMYKDCTENFKQNTMKNMFTVPPANARDRFYAKSSQPTAVQNQQGFSQKDRFEKGFLLPSQRFNKSVASLPIYERDQIQSSKIKLQSTNHINNRLVNTQEGVNNYTDSDQEEIFSENTVREKSSQHCEYQHNNITNQPIRDLDIEEKSCSNHKRTKLLSTPVKQHKSNGIKDGMEHETKPKDVKTKDKLVKDNNKKPKDVKNNNNDFEFIKPQLPIRKSGPGKTKEKLISKSAQPLVDTIMPQSITQSGTTSASATQTNVPAEEPPDETQSNSSELSMRPSFIKRKLFSQKMDVTERKNMSSDAVNVNSPQSNVYSAIQNEKHKARKLVTNQSCLSRDVIKEDNNLLDLIHKIVPPDRMNVTNKTSISTNVSSKNDAVDEDDKWDVTSVISMCNNDNVSDTYTDEEIFATDGKKTNNVKEVKNNNENAKILNSTKNCKILVEKLPQNVSVSTNPVVEVKKTTDPPEGHDNLKKSVYNCVKSFWDTDFESDVENCIPKRWTSAVKENQKTVKENHSKSNIVEADKTIKNKNTLNMSLASVSESIKSKTMPTNNMGKLKLNISKHLSIKSFPSPKYEPTKVKEQKTVKVDRQKVGCSKPSNTELGVTTKQTDIQSKTCKSKNNVSNHKNEVKKPKILDSVTNKKLPSPKNPLNKNIKTMPSVDNTEPNNKITQTKSNNQLTQLPNKTKSKKQSPNKSNINNEQTQSLNKTKNDSKNKPSPNEIKNNNESTQPSNKTKNNKQKRSLHETNNSNKPTQQSKETKSNNNKTPSITENNDEQIKSQIKTKNNKNPAQSPIQINNKKGIRQNTNPTGKTVANRSISVRSTRTPKRKACCGDVPDQESPNNKPVTKSNGHPNKKPKLDDSICAKTKVAKKIIDNTIQNKHAKNSSKNSKKVEPEMDQSLVYESKASNRTLRSRRNINLSSSINSSTENFTFLNLRSLRTRRVDLSSSLKNSSIDDNVSIIKNSRTKSNAKNSGARQGYTELLDKRQRR